MARTSFVIVAYNQARYIEEAMRSAFAQTELPDEIIVSDDCSPDDTFEVMQRVARESGLGERVILNRNPRNLGLVGHVNHLMTRVKGDLILIAGGDDVSHPARVAKTVAAWDAFERPPLIFFMYEPLVEAPIDLEPFVFNTGRLSASFMSLGGNPDVQAPAMAWRRDVFDVFGPLSDRCPTEDKNIAFRAALLGEIVFVSHKLVRYRIHDDNLSLRNRLAANEDKTVRRTRSLQRQIDRLEGYDHDLRTAMRAGLVAPERGAELEGNLARTRASLARRQQELRAPAWKRFLRKLSGKPE